MAVFNAKIIQIEGSRYTNDPNDRGGPTKYGISQRSYPNLDIKNLTLERALAIYKRDFWDAYSLSAIENQNLAEIVFYLIVHSGENAAIKIVQRALNACGYPIKVDGDIGPRTRAAINHAHVGWLTDSIRVAVCKWYLSIVDRDATQKKYFVGWIRRALT